MKIFFVILIMLMLISGCCGSEKKFTEAEKITALNNYRAAWEFKTYNPTSNYAEFLSLAAEVHLKEIGNPNPIPLPVNWNNAIEREAALDIARQAHQDAGN